MPLYDFSCRACGEHYEGRAAMDGPGPACPACGAPEPERLISGFATSRSPGLRGAAAARSNANRRAREEQRAERKERRRSAPG
ncbi:MAG TPA: zinc ribbon domain-containing protein [Solirubrobacteraceae bacterium]|nr:zinc ribbon domain-containing protein [Solirubrobacteraceae bacterium]